MGDSTTFKALLIPVTDDDKKRAAEELIREGKKPTVKNIKMKLQSWAMAGLDLSGKVMD